MARAGMLVLNHCGVIERVICMKPHNEVLKYFMSRKLDTNTGSAVFLTEGWSLCCKAAGSDVPRRLTGAKEPAVPTLYCSSLLLRAKICYAQHYCLATWTLRSSLELNESNERELRGLKEALCEYNNPGNKLMVINHRWSCSFVYHHLILRGAINSLKSQYRIPSGPLTLSERKHSKFQSVKFKS